MLVTIVAIVVVLIVVVLVIAATKPPTFRIERRTSIKSPPQKVFALIDDFHNWTQWSPWENLDPALKRSYSGSASGKGSVYEWLGNKKVGQGRMEIIESAAPSKIAIKLDFLKPFEAHNTAEFTMQPRGEETEVVWAMFGPNVFMSKVMGVFMSMDKMVGKDFEKGLANMKAAAEK